MIRTKPHKCSDLFHCCDSIMERVPKYAAAPLAQVPLGAMGPKIYNMRGDAGSQNRQGNQLSLSITYDFDISYAYIESKSKSWREMS